MNACIAETIHVDGWHADKVEYTKNSKKRSTKSTMLHETGGHNQLSDDDDEARVPTTCEQAVQVNTCNK